MGKSVHRGFVGKGVSMVTRPSWSGDLVSKRRHIRDTGPELEALVTFTAPHKSAVNRKIRVEAGCGYSFPRWSVGTSKACR